MENRRQSPLVPDTKDCDFMFDEGQDNVWIRVRNLAVYIVENDEGVSVDVYPASMDMDEPDEPLACTWALYDEGED